MTALTVLENTSHIGTAAKAKLKLADPCTSCPNSSCDRPDSKKLSEAAQPSAVQQKRLLDAVANSDWSAYDKVAVAFSGGKDSLACALTLLKLGCEAERIVLLHHDVDGQEGSDLYDWAITRDYCRVVAAELGIELRFSWLVGGFEGELFRKDTAKAAIRYELPDGTVGETGGKGKPNTRLRHPAKGKSLSSRWCSAVLKIDVGAAAIRNDPTFNGEDECYLFVSGERREESSGRATYAEIENHRTSCNSRDVTQWRAVIDLGEQEVWDLIGERGIVPHPAYRLGFGRVSCAFCIFASPNQLATLRDLLPDRFDRHAAIEVELDHTVDQHASLLETIEKPHRCSRTKAGKLKRAECRDGSCLGDGNKPTSFAADKPEWLRALARSHTYDVAIAVDPSEWELPAGAFGESAGPV